jgi:hypothetical protein
VHALSLALAGPPIGPPLPAPAHVGPVGEWFLPAVIIGIALILDATAVGGAAKRDRIAAALTYTGALGFIAVYRWAATIQGWVGDSWSWRITGSAISLLVHAGLVIVLIGPWIEKTKKQSAWLSSKVGVTVGAGRKDSPVVVSNARPAGPAGDGSGPSAAVGRLNTKLHLWAAVAACTYVLARGDAAQVPKAIGSLLTGVSGALGMWVVARLGG